MELAIQVIQLINSKNGEIDRKVERGMKKKGGGGITNPLDPLNGILRNLSLLNLSNQFRDNDTSEDFFELRTCCSHVCIESKGSKGESVERGIEAVEVVNAMATGERELIVFGWKFTNYFVDGMVEFGGNFIAFM